EEGILKDVPNKKDEYRVLSIDVSRRLENCRLSVFCRKSHIEKLTDCDAYFENSGEYYFERSPIIFEYIVDFFVTEGHKDSFEDKYAGQVPPIKFVCLTKDVRKKVEFILLER
ncbi:K+ channel tetramerization domain protein, partial [Ancylostoma duodenale]